MSLGRHLDVALTRYCAELDRSGLRIPGELKALAVAFSAQDGTALHEFDQVDGDRDGVCMPLLLKAEETARFLNLSVRTVAKLTADGTLPSVRIGAARLYKTEEVRAFVAELPNAPTRTEGAS